MRVEAVQDVPASALGPEGPPQALMELGNLTRAWLLGSWRLHQEIRPFLACVRAVNTTLQVAQRSRVVLQTSKDQWDVLVYCKLVVAPFVLTDPEPEPVGKPTKSRLAGGSSRASPAHSRGFSDAGGRHLRSQPQPQRALPQRAARQAASCQDFNRPAKKAVRRPDLPPPGGFLPDFSPKPMGKLPSMGVKREKPRRPEKSWGSSSATQLPSLTR
mmetsp:Transcript_44520/g.100672  ORF Transcript_44520/g.100672 Transcript_44520/m.100672 type:complete len:215 (-) Transcript_44520:122-766(-)